MAKKTTAGMAGKVEEPKYTSAEIIAAHEHFKVSRTLVKAALINGDHLDKTLTEKKAKQIIKKFKK